MGNTGINTNADSEIQCSEAAAFTGTINCQGMNISDLTGIEAFTSLTTLLCGNNPLGTIDVSQNTALLTFQPYNNNLSSLDVTANTALGNLVCYGNNLTTLDVTQNPNLNIFVCRKNDLTSLDLTNNTSLNVLVCDSNDLTLLDVSASSGITTLNCSDNSLTSLVLFNIDPTTSSLDATSNPDLLCIEVDDITLAQANWTNIDPVASFSTNCNLTTEINENSKLNNLIVFPNPSSNKITISGLKGLQQLEILDVTGKIVINLTVSNNQNINIESLPKGLYFVRISNNLPLKFIKQ